MSRNVIRVKNIVAKRTFRHYCQSQIKKKGGGVCPKCQLTDMYMAPNNKHQVMGIYFSIRYLLTFPISQTQLIHHIVYQPQYLEYSKLKFSIDPVIVPYLKGVGPVSKYSWQTLNKGCRRRRPLDLSRISICGSIVLAANY